MWKFVTWEFSKIVLSYFLLLVLLWGSAALQEIAIPQTFSEEARSYQEGLDTILTNLYTGPEAHLPDSNIAKLFVHDCWEVDAGPAIEFDDGVRCAKSADIERYYAQKDLLFMTS